MTPYELKKHSQMIDESVTFLERKTEAVWNRYSQLNGCYTQECDDERDELKKEMDGYINKLQNEEKMIDQYEEILHNKTGIK